MCMSSPSAPAPVVQAAPAPLAPVAPIEPPKPMALAEATSSAGSAASRRGGISQLRIASAGGAGVNPNVLGTGAAAKAGLTLQGRKDQLEKQLAAAGG